MNRIFHIAFTTLAIVLVSCNYEKKEECSDVVEKYHSFSLSKNTYVDSSKFIKQIDKVILQNKNCERALQIGGLLYMARFDNKKAKEYFIKAISINPESIYSLFLLSGIYNIEDNNKLALDYINKALMLKVENNAYLDKYSLVLFNFDISYHELIFFRGVILYEMESYANAKNDFLLALSNGHDRKETCQYLASSYFSLNMKDSSLFYQRIGSRN